MDGSASSFSSRKVVVEHHCFGKNSSVANDAWQSRNTPGAADEGEGEEKEACFGILSIKRNTKNWSKRLQGFRNSKKLSNNAMREKRLSGASSTRYPTASTTSNSTEQDEEGERQPRRRSIIGGVERNSCGLLGRLRARNPGHRQASAKRAPGSRVSRRSDGHCRQADDSKESRAADSHHCQILIQQAELESLKRCHERKVKALRREHDVLREQLKQTLEQSQIIQDQLLEQQYWRVQGVSHLNEAPLEMPRNATVDDTRDPFSEADYISKEEEKREESLPPRLDAQCLGRKPGAPPIKQHQQFLRSLLLL